MANRKPVANVVSANGPEDAASIAITLTGSDTDGTIAAFRLSGRPKHGTLFLDAGLTIAATAKVAYPATGNALTLYFRPDADFDGDVHFKYVAIDDRGARSPAAKATIDVAAVNDAPTPTDVAAKGKEDSTVEIKLKGTDGDGKVASYRIVDLPADGVLYLNKNGTGAVAVNDVIAAGTKLYFKPNADWNGTTGFHYAAIDKQGAESIVNATATINVAAVNDAPVTNDVSAAGNIQSHSIPVTLTGNDADGTITAFKLHSLPKNGTLFLDAGLTQPVNIDTKYPATAESLTLYFKPLTGFAGTTSFKFAAFDELGKKDQSPAVATLDVSTDTTPPAAPTIVSFADDTENPDDGLTRDRTLTLSGTAEANARVEVFNGASSLGTTLADDFGQWTFNTASLADDVYTFTAKATDAAANTSASSNLLTVTVDATAPAAPVIVSFADDTGPTGDGLTADRTLVLSGTAEPGARVEIFNGAVSLGSAMADGLGQWTFNTQALADDDYAFTAKATDAATNTSASSNLLTVTVDATAPDAPVIVSLADDTGDHGDGMTTDRTLTLSGTAEAGAIVEVFNGAASLGTTLADGLGQWTFDTSSLADDIYNFTAKASDATGNTSASSNLLTVTVDGTAPAAPVILSFGDDTGAPDDGLTADRTLTLSGAAEAGASVEIFNGAASLGSAIADGLGQWTFNTASLADDVYTFTAIATDATGNTSASSNALTVTVDGTAPNAPLLTSFTDDTGASGDGLTADRTLTLAGFAFPGTSVEVFDGTTSLGTTVADFLGIWRFDTVTLAYGVHDFTARTSDAAGNTASSDVLTVAVDPTEPDDAVDDAFTVTTFSSVSGNLAANDTLIYDSGGVLLSSYALTQGVPWAGPTHGDLILNPDGTFTYTPTGSIQGTDRFAYTITGPGGVTSTAVVTITIVPDNQPEIAQSMDFGETAAEIDFAVDSNGRPTGIDGVQFRIGIDELTAFVTGDPADIIDRLKLFASNTPLFTGSGSDGPVSLFDPNAVAGPFVLLPQTSAQIVGDEIVVTIAPSYFAPGSTVSGTFGFRFGYENYSVVDGRVGLGTDFPLDVVIPGFSDKFARFSSGLNVIDDRGNSPGPLGDLLQGLAGQDGKMYLLNVPGPARDLILDVADVLILAGQGQIQDPLVVLEELAEIYLSVFSGFDGVWAEYLPVNGPKGEDALISLSESVTGESASDVIFGRNGVNAGHGGNGGNATDGADGLPLFLNPFVVVPLHGPGGGDGGDGGDGGSTAYSIDGGAGDDTIIGGNGGTAGNGGDRGLPGQEGADYPLFDPVTAADRAPAEGGPGGTGGAGGLGGDTNYSIAGGDGNDVIYGGKGGNGGSTPFSGGAAGSALYSIDGGNGDDTIYGGEGGTFIGGGGDVDYVITGGAGNDVVHGGAENNSNYSLDGGDGNDSLHIGQPYQDGDSATYHAGTSLNNGSSTFFGVYAVDGGAGDDTIDLSHGFFNSLRVDGGAGFDTMIMRYPVKAGFQGYTIDFNAGAVGGVPAIRDMITSVEHLVLDNFVFGFDATMSAESIKAMTSTVTNYETPVGITIPSTSLMFVDGIGDATLTLSDAEEWLAAGEQVHFGETYDVYFHFDENVFLLTRGFDDLL